MEKQQLILNTLKEKASTKQSVYRVNQETFELLKLVTEELAKELNTSIQEIDKNVTLSFENKGKFEAKLQFSGDVLVYHMHSNTFLFDKSHHIWKSSYVKEDKYRGYCGVINIYNFLNDSFKYNRINDLGFLVARIFINKDKHFFVEGDGRLGFLFNDFKNDIINAEIIKKIVEELIIHAMNFELISQPFKEVQIVSLHQVLEMSKNLKLKTAKKLGYKFKGEK